MTQPTLYRSAQLLKLHHGLATPASDFDHAMEHAGYTLQATSQRQYRGSSFQRTDIQLCYHQWCKMKHRPGCSLGVACGAFGAQLSERYFGLLSN